MRIQTGTGSSQQISGNILPFDLRIFRQKRFDICFHPFGQRFVGRRIVGRTGAQSGEPRIGRLLGSVDILVEHLIPVLVKGVVMRLDGIAVRILFIHNEEDLLAGVILHHIVLGPVLIFNVNIVMVLGRTAPQVVIFSERLTDVFGTERHVPHLYKATLGLAGENQGGQPAEQRREQQSADEHQDECHHNRLSGVVRKTFYRGFHNGSISFLKDQARSAAAVDE